MAKFKTRETFTLNSLKDFVTKTNSVHTLKANTDFDKLLQKCWESAQNNGMFNYGFDSVKTKVLPGKFGFFVQLNEKRSAMRRKPQVLTEVFQPFDHSKFNFTKIKEGEIMFDIDFSLLFNKDANQNHTNDHAICESNGDSDKTDESTLEKGNASVIINSAPMCYGHSLLVPELSQCHIQMVEAKGLTMAVAITLLSNTPSFRIGFNSLCGHASVNHYHYHVYYSDYVLPLEIGGCERLAGNCFVFSSYPCNGFVLQLNDQDIHQLISDAMKIIDILKSEEVPYNVGITRGQKLDGSSPKGIYDTVRLAIFPRSNSTVPFDVAESMFAAACCEFSGFVTVYNEAAWEQVTEDMIVETLYLVCRKTYNAILPKVKNAFTL